MYIQNQKIWNLKLFDNLKKYEIVDKINSHNF